MSAKPVLLFNSDAFWDEYKSLWTKKGKPNPNVSKKYSLFMERLDDYVMRSGGCKGYIEEVNEMSWEILLKYLEGLEK